tara:strand:+ start:3587 stop:3973 length:387 start_codon:yes stop_codon:yes gene_type:complete
MKVDKLVKVYVKIRDERKKILSDYEKRDSELKESLETIEEALLEVCKDTGADSLRTEFGTITRRVQKRYRTADFEAFSSFVKENDAIELLEKRISQNNMSTFLQENPDKIPPGLIVDSKYAISVRRKT